MNELKLSGTLETDVQSTMQNYVLLRTSRIRFDSRGGAIPIIASGAAGEELARFSKGSGVLVTGRLLIHFQTQRFAVFADHVTRFHVGVRKPDSLWMNRGRVESDAPKEETHAQT